MIFSWLLTSTATTKVERTKRTVIKYIGGKSQGFAIFRGQCETGFEHILNGFHNRM